MLDKILNDVRKILEDDLDKYWDFLSREDNQFWRRGFVRAAFAYIEGIVYTMKLKALFRHHMLRHDFSRLSKPTKAAGSLEEFFKVQGERIAEIDKGAGFYPWEILYLVEMTVELSEDGETKAKWGADAGR